VARKEKYQTTLTHLLHLGQHSEASEKAADNNDYVMFVRAAAECD
jgi:hypothetical protein